MTTKEQIEAYLGIEIDSSLTGAVTFWIASVTSYIQKYTGRIFASAEYTEEYKGSGLNYLNLKQYPVTELEKVERNTNTVADPVWEDITEYVYSQNDSGQIYISSGFFQRERHYKVTYTAGYGTIPEDLQLLATAMVGDIIKNQSNSAKTAKKETLGEYSMEFTDMSQYMTDWYKQILNSYRTPKC